MGLLRWLSVCRDRRQNRPTRLPHPFNSISHLASPASGASAAERVAHATTASLATEQAATEATRPAKPPSQRWLARMPLKWKIAVFAPALLIGAAAVDTAAMMIYYTIVYPNPGAVRGRERSPVVRILAHDGSVLAERGKPHAFTPLGSMPRHLKAAVVATEDRRFYGHWGVDPVGLARAFFANLRVGRFAQGGSTLTQQLAKNLFLTSDRTLSRKVEEFGLALWLELRLSKDEILELYLNRVYFGGGAYGVEAASQRYFDKPVGALTLGEAAIIAGLLKAPSKYSPASSPGAARARGRVVLAKMADAGVITRNEQAAADNERIVFDAPKADRKSSGVDYAVDFVLERLPPLIASDHSEIVVETTFDNALQRRAGEIVASNLSFEGVTLAASQAAVIVMDNGGAIRAVVGGRDYAESQFNRAVKAQRQPGSAFKSFVYLAAMESGQTPDSIGYDLPIAIGDWSPRNDNGKYVGEIALRRALAQSINTVAVRLNQQVGTRRTIEAARRLGVESELRLDASIALGTSEVNLLEMTGAYAAFAAGGMRAEPHAIRSVRLSSGQVLYQRQPRRSRQAIAPHVVAAMNDMLTEAVVAGTGKRATLVGHQAAGKTGTTQEFRDAWFVGYTSHLTAGVWIGNDNGRPMNRAVGGGLPADLWRQIMQFAHEGKAPLALPGTARAVIAAPAAPMAYPTDRIDEAFLARVLADDEEPASQQSSAFWSFGRWW